MNKEEYKGLTIFKEAGLTDFDNMSLSFVEAVAGLRCYYPIMRRSWGERGTKTVMFGGMRPQSSRLIVKNEGRKSHDEDWIPTAEDMIADDWVSNEAFYNEEEKAKDPNFEPCSYQD